LKVATDTCSAQTLPQAFSDLREKPFPLCNITKRIHRANTRAHTISVVLLWHCEKTLAVERDGEIAGEEFKGI